MKKLSLLAFAGLLVACSDPAEKVAPATVEPAEAPKPAEAAKPVAAKIPPAPEGALALSPANTKLEWTGSKVTGSQTGSFGTFTGYVVPGEGGDLTKSRIAVEIDMASVDAQPAKLQKHLRSDDFFAVDKHPTATFTSTAISPNEGGGFTITGDLMLRGVKKSISFPATLEAKDGGLSARAEFKINRHDFGVSYPGAKDNLIRDEVVLKLDVNAGK